MAKRCPTPGKQAHPNEGKAALVHAYQCSCGSWHIGGRRKKFGRKRVQR